MLNSITPLRAGVIGVAAANVNWGLRFNGKQIFSIRRACGSNLIPAPIGTGFPFEFLPIWSVVISQAVDPNPFVVMASSRCHADQVVLDSSQDIRVRLNVPDASELLIEGSYDLWVNPFAGLPSCGGGCGASK